MAKAIRKIISVSRRTDIPAYYADWFRKRLEVGYVAYPNPISNKPVILSLKPESVRAFVFWTRNPNPLFKHLDYIDAHYGPRHYMHFTINGLPQELEMRNPKIDTAIESAKRLRDRYKSSEYIQWRYDPIVVSTLTSVNYIVDTFSDIAMKMKEVTTRCYFSFVDLYTKTKRNFQSIENNMAKEGMKFDLRYATSTEENNIELQCELISALQNIAESYNIKLYACAEDLIKERVPGIEKAHCVDADIIDRIAPIKNSSRKLMPSRIGCGCFDSVDIGYYDSCPHGCIYCYANMNPELALEKAREFQANGFPLDNLENKSQNNQPELRFDTK
jgi:hypothetical protein